MIGLDEIQQMLPHRDPMLLLDTVTACDPEVGITAHKTVTADDPWLAPANGNKRIYPAMLVVESWCQAAAMLIFRQRAAQGQHQVDGRVYLGTLAQVELLGDAGPGDVIEHQAKWSMKAGSTPAIYGCSTVDGRRILHVGRALLLPGRSNQ